MQLTFLGTSCMVPTKERNVSGLYFEFKGEGILFDCGEGTQRQMNITGIKRTNVRKILITHWHGDHVSGIMGLIQTISNNDDPPKIEIFGPRGTKSFMDHLMKATIFEARIEINVCELNPRGQECFYENEDYRLECAYLEHSAPSLGYSFIQKDRRKIKMSYLKSIGVGEGPHLRKLQEGKNITFKGKQVDVSKATYMVGGKKITVLGDTRPCTHAVNLAKDADIFICESTYDASLHDKACKYKHMTAKEAALMANQATVKKLYLTHFSQRYKTSSDILADAKTYFDNVVCAEDFMKIKL